jgi:hypothetical protein
MWHDEIPPSPGHPWLTWFDALSFPRGYGPLDAGIERWIEDTCRAADKRRLAVAKATECFPQMWAAFRHRHDELDDCYECRRKRWLLWRCAALKVAHDRGDFQDAIDANQVRDKLIASYATIGPLDINGSYGKYNIWRPAPGSNIEAYAADVLALFSVATPRVMVP